MNRIPTCSSCGTPSEGLVCGDCDGRAERDAEIAKLRADLERCRMSVSNPATTVEDHLQRVLVEILNANLPHKDHLDLDRVLCRVEAFLVTIPGDARGRLWEIIRQGRLCPGCGADNGGDSVCYGSSCYQTPCDE